MNERILLYDAREYDRTFFEKANNDFGFSLKYCESHLTADTARLAEGCQGICIFVNDMLTREVADVLYETGVELIALRCAGYNNIDLKGVYKRIRVVRVPAYSPYAVAEHALSLMMALNRKTHKAYSRTRDMNFNINGLLGFDMHGKTAGVIGTGKIGRILIGILKGLGMNVTAYDPYPDKDAADELGFTYVDLNRLYGNSDIISLNCPLTKDTYHLVNSKTIAEMKDGVMIINTGRGQLIDTPALIDGLKARKIGSAGLDVYEEESEYFYEDFSTEIISDDTLARLISFNNVLVTSHQAFFTGEALTNISQTTLRNFRDYFEKSELPNEICYRCGNDSCVKKKTGRCWE